MKRIAKALLASSLFLAITACIWGANVVWGSGASVSDMTRIVGEP